MNLAVCQVFIFCPRISSTIAQPRFSSPQICVCFISYLLSSHVFCSMFIAYHNIIRKGFNCLMDSNYNFPSLCVFPPVSVGCSSVAPKGVNIISRYRVSHKQVPTLCWLFSRLPVLVQRFILPFFNSPGDDDSKTHLTFLPTSKIDQVTEQNVRQTGFRYYFFGTIHI